MCFSKSLLPSKKMLRRPSGWRLYYHYLSFVVLVGSAAVELQFGVGVITLIVLAHPGDEGEVLGVLNPQRPWEQEVHKAAVFESKAEVVEVPQDEGVGLDRWGLYDAVKNHPITIVLEDAGGDQLGAVVAAVPLSNLRQKKHQTYVMSRDGYRAAIPLIDWNSPVSNSIETSPVG